MLDLSATQKISLLFRRGFHRGQVLTHGWRGNPPDFLSFSEGLSLRRGAGSSRAAVGVRISLPFWKGFH